MSVSSISVNNVCVFFNVVPIKPPVPQMSQESFPEDEDELSLALLSLCIDET